MANTALIRRSPIREMTTLRDVVDRLFDDSFFRPYRQFGVMSAGILMDVWEEGDRYLVDAAIPGARPEDVDVSLQGNTLTVSGRVDAPEGEGRNYLMQELTPGEFSRTVTLPVELDADQVQATFENGVLHLVLPKAAAYQPKRIQIQSGR